MKIDINIFHNHKEGHDLKEVLSLLHSIITNQEIIMTKQESMDLSLAGLNQATNDIAARIQKLIDAGADNVTQESLDALSTDVEALKLIGTSPIKKNG